MLVIRKVLDDFCADHDLDVASALAIEAAQHLVDQLESGEDSPEALRSALDKLLEHEIPPRRRA